MPFKSQAQRRLFYAMADRGEISDEKVKEWEAETPKGKKLPERVSKESADKDLHASSFAQMAGDYALGKLALFAAIHSAYISDRDRERYNAPLSKEAVFSAGTQRLGKVLSWGTDKALRAAGMVGQGALSAGGFALRHPMVAGAPIAFGAGVMTAKPKTERAKVAGAGGIAGVPGSSGVSAGVGPRSMLSLRRLPGGPPGPLTSMKAMVEKGTTQGDAQTGRGKAEMPSGEGAVPQIQRVGV